MARKPSVGVDHDLAAGQPSIRHRSADDETAGRVDERADPAVLQLGGDHSVDDVLADVRPQLLGGDLVVMLGGEHHRIHDRRLACIAISDRHLHLAIGTQVVERLGAANLREATREPMREHDRQRHELRGFIARETEHHARVAGPADVDALRDIGRLLVDARDHAAGLGVEAVLRPRVAHLSHGLADDPGDVDVAVSGDLSDHDDQASRDDGLASHTRERVFGQDGIEDGVGDLVCDLVRMALGDRLRRKQASCHGRVLL